MKKIFLAICCLLMPLAGMAEHLQLPPAAEFSGGVISYEAASDEFETTMQSYTDFGWGENAADAEAIAMQVLENLVQEAVLRNKALELGLTEPPVEELNTMRQTAAAMFEEQISYYIDFYASEGTTAEDARSATIDMLAEDGITPESILNEMLDDWWYSALYEYVCADIVISEEDIRNYADALATSQALEYADDPINFDYLYMNDDLIAWYPDGMRYIKHILIGFDEAQAEAYASVVGEGTLGDADPDALDAVYAPLADRVAEVENLLMEGADFDDLMRSHGADEFMLHEPYAADGYIVQPGSQLFVKEFVDACFALENIGDISEPIRTSGGVHFILYVGDVPAGNADLSAIMDAVTAEAQDQLISDAFDAQVAAWIREAAPVYHPEYLLQ